MRAEAGGGGGRQGEPVEGSPGLFRWRGNVLRDPQRLADGSYVVVDHVTGAVVYAGVPDEPGCTSPTHVPRERPPRARVHVPPDSHTGAPPSAALGH
jgi:hypothetical protein